MYTYVYTGSSGSTRPPDIYICMSTYKYIQIHIHKRRQQAHHERLLRRGAAAAHDRGAPQGDGDKLPREIVGAEGEGAAVDDEAGAGLFLQQAELLLGLRRRRRAQVEHLDVCTCMYVCVCININVNMNVEVYI